MSGGGGGGGDTRVMFSVYLETAHQEMISHKGVESLTKSVFQAMNEATNLSPYDGVETITASEGYLGTGKRLSDFPALFDQFTALMSGVDVDALWASTYTQQVQGTEVQDAVAAQGSLIQDEIDERVMPAFLAGSRDINSVMSSAFVMGKALIAESKIKKMADFSSQLKLQQMTAAREMWAKKLDWNKSVVMAYADLQKFYYTVHFDAQARQLEYESKNILWNLSLFEYGRSTIGALNGAPAAVPTQLPSQTAKGIAGAMAGASAGATLGAAIGENNAGVGAAAGGVLGLAASFL